MAGFDPDAFIQQESQAPAFDPDAFVAEHGAGPPRSFKQKAEDLVGLGGGPQKPWNYDDLSGDDRAQYAQYKRNLPATLASAGSMMLPIPASPVAAIGALGAEGAATGALEPAQDSTERLKNTLTGGATAAALGTAAEGLTAGARAAWPAAKRLGAKLGELVTGTPKQEIQTYAEQGPAIQQMMKEADGSVPAAADNVREGWQKAIQDKKAALNSQIDTALAASPKKASVSIQPIIDELESQKAQLNPNFHPEAIGAINGLIAQVKMGAAPESFGPKWVGMTNAKNMNLIKQYLQNRASSSYAEGGQIFQSAPQAARAAKAAAAKARGILNEMEPAVADANNQLAAIHDIDNDLNQNLIAPGKSDTALMAAGSGNSPRNAMLLEQLGNAIGKDMVGDAQKLAAARTFTAPKWDPREMTGKSLYRAGVGAALGGVAAHESGEPWEAGAVAGGLLASPAALKLAIDAGRPMVGIAQKIGPKAAALLRGAAPIAAGQVTGQYPSSPDQAAPAQQLANRSPAVGYAKFAQDGLNKLGIADPALSARLMADPNAMRLLLQAHDLPANHKNLQSIMDQIRKGWTK